MSWSHIRHFPGDFEEAPYSECPNCEERLDCRDCADSAEEDRQAELEAFNS